MRRMTIDRDEPASVISCVMRAREGARTVRDVISAEMWEAINTTNLRLSDQDVERRLELGPYNFFQLVKERSALFWGLNSRTMLRDEARAFLVAGGRFESADMVLRMLRSPSRRRAVGRIPRRGRPASSTGRRRRCCRPSAGSRRSDVPSVAPAGRPVARFLLYERAYPDSVAASVDAVQAALSRTPTSIARRSDPVLRLARLGADLEFRGRIAIDPASIAETCELVQRELMLVDADIASRYFMGSAAAARRDGARMNYDIHYVIDYHYSGTVTDNLNTLRVRHEHLTQRCDEFQGAPGSRGAHHAAHRLLRCRGARVRGGAPA